MGYVQFSIDPAGSGERLYQPCEATQRTIHIVNLDPAAENFDYPVAMGLARMILTFVDLDTEVETLQSSVEKISATCEDRPITEPYVGMEFESEEAARDFYGEYGRREGFIMRLDRCHRSEVDNRILSRRLSCNKQGFYARARNGTRPVRRPRVSIREGCEAMMLVKVNKHGKWIVTKFVKEHCHPLQVSGCPSYVTLESKDKKIQDLTRELQHQDQLCQLYRQLLLSLLKNVEEQTEVLSGKIALVVSSVKQLENEVKKPVQA
ncbi:protein FAR1-RELATED SEQUENCE 5-like [Senna tora]|uniref:Protein FAR1-RELATED SEQUENCE 5-like n=1 Tax=Senna tora TaxID=362788 RepID=A0A834TNM5_9FABA|nr:protein FAR1-RELATED SEQUENCE 5-like [Senna tora]